MKFKTWFLSSLAILIFLSGVLLQLGLSSGIVWAETEAAMYGTQMNGSGLSLNCPLTLSSVESGMVATTITNTTDQQVLPVITAEISKGDSMQSARETLTLAPQESRTLQWSVDASNRIFDRLILVNVIQARYRDLDPQRGFCGVFVFDLFNLNGRQSLVLIIIASIVLILAGGTLWIRLHIPLDQFADQTLLACGGLAGVTTLVLVMILMHWWGIALFLLVFAFIMLAVILTDFVLFPRKE